MVIDDFDLKYVIGFPIKNNEVLLIKRKKHPWVNRWNGAGGKIEAGETPFQAIFREISEETNVNLNEAKITKFAGVVTWDTNEEGDKATGMYAFLSELSMKQQVWKGERTIGEGTLAWKPLEWACDKENKEIADNIPYFLPLMMAATKPMRYHCVYQDNILKEVKVLELSQDMNPGEYHR